MSATTVDVKSRESDPQRALGRLGIYLLLAIWAFICIFPIYWTVTTSVKSREAVIQGPKYIPYVDFEPDNKGWFPLIFEAGGRANFLKHFQNTLVVSLLAALLAVILGSLAAYGLSRYQYQYGPYDNTQIRNFFLAQLILPDKLDGAMRRQLLSGGYEVAAGVRQQLEADARRLPGTRLLPGRFMVINQAVGVPRGREAGLPWLRAYVEALKASGFVAQALRRHGIEGAGVAPPAP